MSRLLSLYPRTWRDRYGEELTALIADRPPTLADRIDIVRGAVDARLHPQLPGPARAPDRSGFAPLIGLVPLIAALWLAANGPVQYDKYGTYRDGAAAALPFVVAVGLLLFGLYRILLHLPPTARIAFAAGWIAIGAGALWSMMPWFAGAALPFFVGMLVFVLGAHRAGVVSLWFAIAILVVLVLPIGLYSAMAVLPWYAMRQSGLDLVVFVAPLCGLYLVVGLGLLRGIARPATT